MTSIRLTLAAALLTGTAAFTTAMAVETKPVTNEAASTAAEATAPRPANQANQAPANNNAQAGMNDMGQNTAPNTQAQNQANPADTNVRTAMNESAGANANADIGISSDASSTQVKESRLRSNSAKQKSFNDQAETTKQLNEQAAQMARNG